MAGQPTSMTVGFALRLKLDPPQVRPPRLPVSVIVWFAVINLARVIIGVVYFKECPQQPNIPNYILGLVLWSLIMIQLMSYGSQPQPPPSCLKACVMVMMSLFIFCWILAGDVWVFSVYQPNYDPTAADGLYCNKTLYTFAFWNALLETFAMVAMLTKNCIGLMCCVILDPAPTNTEFYRNV
ncbi:transmembrane protein 272-like [Genypterus blacodes]|uniref:transmembrane protein 272-like n=1 Tax=Genypterus blacodes TaxID=154954 RepID=UPI003F75B33F